MEHVFNLCVILALLFISTISAVSYEAYISERERLIAKSQSFAIGANIVLNKKEEKVNDILMKWKIADFDNGLRNPSEFLSAQHFFRARDNITKSPIYQFIRKIPKGAALHMHELSLTTEEYVFNLTFRENLYAYINSTDGLINFKFFKSSPGSPWRTMADLRKKITDFDEMLRAQLTLRTDDPEAAYPDQNAVWRKFASLFDIMDGLLTYKLVFEEYFYQGLKELYEDNVKYMEFRSPLPQVYELDGRIYEATEVLDIHYNTLKRFQADFPDFLGAKIIYSSNRRVEPKEVSNYGRTFFRLKRLHPDFTAGFDLDNHEDEGRPLIDFAPQLLIIKEGGAKFFFHAAETSWFGQPSDRNLFDAVLLNSSRIGHAYGLIKHPELQRLVKEKDIAIEIPPISNQVLKLVEDLRNHPGYFLIANGFPVVISCDNLTFWGAKGLSYDWYMVFMALSSKQSDLRLLKQLAINSIKYSAMEPDEKRRAMTAWQKDWNAFIQRILTDSKSPRPRSRY